jgi:hypothetical protein
MRAIIAAADVETCPLDGVADVLDEQAAPVRLRPMRTIVMERFMEGNVSAPRRYPS